MTYQEHNGGLQLRNGGSSGGEMAKKTLQDEREGEGKEREREREGGREREEGNEEKEEADSHFNESFH